MEGNEFDLVVIGSGPAGQKAAICAAKLRKKVAIVDRKKTMRRVRAHRDHPQQDSTRSCAVLERLSPANVLWARLRAQGSHCDVGSDVSRTIGDAARGRGD